MRWDALFAGTGMPAHLTYVLGSRLLHIAIEASVDWGNNVAIAWAASHLKLPEGGTWTCNFTKRGGLETYDFKIM